jgi:hypothetical protein
MGPPHYSIAFNNICMRETTSLSHAQSTVQYIHNIKHFKHLANHKNGSDNCG